MNFNFSLKFCINNKFKINKKEEIKKEIIKIFKYVELQKNTSCKVDK